MIKVEATADFTLARFNEIKIIKRKNLNIAGKLYLGDIFECEKEMCDYLMGNNSKGVTVVKILEIIPEEKLIKKTTKKKTTKN